MFKKVFSVVLAVGFVTFACAFLYRQLPCRSPIAYSIGDVSLEFAAGREEFAMAVREGARLWEEAAGRTLFREMGTGGMGIAAVYDERQQARDRLQEIGIRLDEGKRTFDALRTQYDTRRKVYDDFVEAYGALRTVYERARAAYQADLAMLDQNRASDPMPRDTFMQLEQKRQEVNALVLRLNRMREELAGATESVNAVVAVLQQIALQENYSLEQYEQVGAAIGDEYEAALYERRWGEERITVYSFDSVPELTRLVTHELGHAIGLSHIDDPNALMYRLNQTGLIALSPTDVALVQERCSLHPGVWLALRDAWTGRMTQP